MRRDSRSEKSKKRGEKEKDGRLYTYVHTGTAASVIRAQLDCPIR